jgi:pimeloyl-ACP methyl ester carboxylesterase
MIRKMLSFIVISLVITLCIPFVLILSQPVAELPEREGLDFTNVVGGGTVLAMPLSQVLMRDGYELQVRRYETDTADAPLLVLVHGSGWHGLQYDTTARDLSTHADVVVPDLRGHGTKPGVRGDIAYIGQFEDDLADLITALRKPDQKVILGGHSSGGGLVARFAGGAHGDMIDGAIMLAPFLKHDAPMQREDGGGWAHPLLRRIIGLSILNGFNVQALNHLTIMQFNMPKVVMDGPLGDTATTEYSYRLNTAFAPRSDYLKDVAALPRFALIVGAQDEVFFADAYEPTLSKVTDKGSYLIVDGVNHLDIVSAPETAARIKEFLNDL